MLEILKEALGKDESEFIYNVLEIQNSSQYGQSMYRFWYDDFRENFNSREGDVYEFGVYRGASLLGFALLAKILGSKKHFWGFDSFSGFPGYSAQDEFKNFNKENGFSSKVIEDHQLLLKLRSPSTKVRGRKNLKTELTSLGEELTHLGGQGLFEDTSLDGVLKKIELLELDNITLVPGDFAQTVKDHFSNQERKIFSANIDCDLYAGYKICLPPIFKYLEMGGYVHLDEYYSLKYPGPKIATDEFLATTKHAKLIKNNTRNGEFERYCIIKE